MEDLVFSVSDFVAVFNQTLEYAYPSVTVVGELANFRISKNRWVYFDLKDEQSSVKFFGTVYQLPGPLEDGLLIQVTGTPRLHQMFGFSITAQQILPVGEGSLKRASELLEMKLRAEGLFDESRKRLLPYPPQKIGLIASDESAAYHDFIKIINERWGGVEIYLANVQVQGTKAPGQIIEALEYFNTTERTIDVIVITRGGGSAEDLAAFNHERLTRAVATSRIPTIVAIGHEIDISLAELAADKRASTPSNAAELLVPDKRDAFERLHNFRQTLKDHLQRCITDSVTKLNTQVSTMTDITSRLLSEATDYSGLKQQILVALSPQNILKRGYSIVRYDKKTLTSTMNLKRGQLLEIQLSKGNLTSEIVKVQSST